MKIYIHYEKEQLPQTVEHLIELNKMITDLTLDQLVGEYDIDVYIRPHKSNELNE